MSTTKFRIPGTDIYLLSDGRLSSQIENGENVNDLIEEHGHMIDVIYHGQLLRQMRFLSSSGTNGSGQDITNPFVIEANSAITHLIGVDPIRFAGNLDNWINGHEGVDPLMQQLNQLHLSLGKLQDFALGAWVSAREDNLAFLLAHSSAALHTANEFLKTGAPRSDTVWAAKIANAERDSLIAVETFKNIEGGYWLRPESLTAISWAGNPTDYYRGWMPHMVDRAKVNHFNQVWDYRWAQPVLIYAIIVRLVVLKALREESTVNQRLYCDEIEGYTKLLGGVFSKRVSGIRTLNGLNDIQRHKYGLQGHIPLAAADIYGGDYLAGVFWLNSFLKPEELWAPGVAAPDIDKVGPFDISWAEKNVKAFARHWWYLHYLRTGLHELLLLISEMQVICDKPWFPRKFIDANRELRALKSGVSHERAAFTAMSLADLIQSEDGVANANNTHFLYKAFRTQGEQAKKIVEGCIRELLYPTKS